VTKDTPPLQPHAEFMKRSFHQIGKIKIWDVIAAKANV
jgi:hypothetical protein